MTKSDDPSKHPKPRGKGKPKPSKNRSPFSTPRMQRISKARKQR